MQFIKFLQYNRNANDLTILWKHEAYFMSEDALSASQIQLRVWDNPRARGVSAIEYLNGQRYHDYVETDPLRQPADVPLGVGWSALMQLQCAVRKMSLGLRMRDIQDSKLNIEGRLNILLESRI
jgi:hypothetical protein